MLWKKEMHNSIQMSSHLEWKRSNFAFLNRLKNIPECTSILPWFHKVNLRRVNVQSAFVCQLPCLSKREIGGRAAQMNIRRATTDIDAARDLMWLPGRTMKCFPFCCSARSFIAFQKSSRVIWIAIKRHAKLSIRKHRLAHLHSTPGHFSWPDSGSEYLAKSWLALLAASLIIFVRMFPKCMQKHKQKSKTNNKLSHYFMRPLLKTSMIWCRTESHSSGSVSQFVSRI